MLSTAHLKGYELLSASSLRMTQIKFSDSTLYHIAVCSNTVSVYKRSDVISKALSDKPSPLVNEGFHFTTAKSSKCDPAFNSQHPHILAQAAEFLNENL